MVVSILTLYNPGEVFGGRREALLAHNMSGNPSGIPSTSMEAMERSHYLFLYSCHVNLERHILSMKELCREAKEVRAYPLVTLEGKCSGHIDPVVAELQNVGMDICFQKVRYRFQKGAEEMLVITSINTIYLAKN